MSGPVRSDDVAAPTVRTAVVDGPTIEVTPSREAQVGGMTVRRALPRRERRTVGAWCFADHMGPTEDAGPGIGPHPHIGLQTVTWLVAGEALHRDSLASEETIRPGELNLMTAGRGISHAEESITRRPHGMHGIQLWVAQPESTRQGDPAFEHHADLPRLDLGEAVATVLVGDFAGTSSTARRDTDHVGVDLQLRPGATVAPLQAHHEYALVVLEGTVGIGEHRVTPGHLAYLGLGRDELALTTAEPSRLLLLGGAPFESPILMWWNFVARSRDEMDVARADWNAGGARFGDTGSLMERIPAPRPPWSEPQG